jgi:hypothetical protein
MEGAEISMCPKPASSAMGVRVSLFCAGRVAEANRIRQGRYFTYRFLAIEFDAAGGRRDSPGGRSIDRTATFEA